MTSEKQIQANRINAQKGGVKTLEGKDISKFNPLKHGLLSKEVLLKDEAKQDFVKLATRMRETLQPVGEIEVLLTERLLPMFGV